MAHIHSIIPPYVSRAIIDSPHVEEHVKNYHRLTLERTAALQAIRFNLPDPGAPGPAFFAQSIIPPFIHQNLATSSMVSQEQRDASARTLAHDSEFRAARHGLERTPPAASFAPAAPKQERIIYDFQHDSDYNKLPGTIVLIEEGGAPIPEEKDPSGDANEAYEHLKDTWDFYYQLFQRNSIDDKGLKLIASVHFGDKYQNAFWSGQQMVFGDGDGVIFLQFTGLVDVVGHELTHGVITSTSNLVYANQSGALNESLADVFGIQIKQWKAKQTDPATADWVIGKGIWGPKIKGRGLRDMAAPGTAYDDPIVGKDPQPATMAGYVQLHNDMNHDYGGVHLNSGIPNHAFYLAAVKIGRPSWEGAGPVWYRAMVDEKLRPNADFEDFARLTVAHAGEFAAEVTAAWGEVGIVVGKHSGHDGE